MAVVYHVEGSRPSWADSPQQLPWSPEPRLYDHTLISCSQQFCKTGFAIGPIFQMKRVRPSLQPFCPIPRLPGTEGTAGNQGRGGGAAKQQSPEDRQGRKGIKRQGHSGSESQGPGGIQRSKGQAAEY